MLPFDETVFVSHVRRLGPTSQRAFLADVFRAMGHEVEIRDGAVVVRKEGTQSRFGVPADAGDGRLQVVDASELAEMVAYGLSEAAARECCERHLGAPPAGLEAPATVRVRRGAASLRPALSPALTLLVVLVLLGAIALGPGAPPAQSADDDGASNGSAVGERVTEQSVPPEAEYESTAAQVFAPQWPAGPPEDLGVTEVIDPSELRKPSR